MTWPPQSPNLNPIAVVWMSWIAELRNCCKQVLSICGNSIKTVGKVFQVKLVERMPRVCKDVSKAMFRRYYLMKLPVEDLSVSQTRH